MYAYLAMMVMHRYAHTYAYLSPLGTYMHADFAVLLPALYRCPDDDSHA